MLFEHAGLQFVAERLQTEECAAACGPGVALAAAPRLEQLPVYADTAEWCGYMAAVVLSMKPRASLLRRARGSLLRRGRRATELRRLPLGPLYLLPRSPAPEQVRVQDCPRGASNET